MGGHYRERSGKTLDRSFRVTCQLRLGREQMKGGDLSALGSLDLHVTASAPTLLYLTTLLLDCR